LHLFADIVGFVAWFSLSRCGHAASSPRVYFDSDHH
jgi:hypothetical protein